MQQNQPNPNPNPKPISKAKDALATIDGRLSGSLIGVVSLPAAPPLSVEGQVARLIAEAVDHENLGRMYIWWMPWF
jgi:serine/threonine-protein kinase ATR